jgi:hypothetical protein
MQRFFLLCLVLLATTSRQSSANSTCVGERNTYIDREYCDAINANEARDAASCTSREGAGCECIYEPNDHCTVPDKQLCGEYVCLAPEASLFVGSCHFMDNEQSCESVTGCSWEPYEVGRPNLHVEITTESSSSLSVAGVVVVVLLAVGALVLPVAIYFLVRKRMGTKDTPGSQADDILIASATAIDLELPKNDISSK